MSGDDEKIKELMQLQSIGNSIAQKMVESGFTNLEIYGDLKLSRFEDLKSANLVVIAEKLDYK